MRARGNGERIDLQRLSSYIEKNVKLKAAVKSAMIYPAATLTIMTGLVILLLWKVVPVFPQLFLGLGADLPLPTRIVIGLSNFVQNWIILIIVGAIALFFGARFYYQTPGGKYFFDSLMLKIPLIGILLRKIATARFTRTLGTLIASGVPILEGLSITPPPPATPSSRRPRWRGGRGWGKAVPSSSRSRPPTSFPPWWRR